MQIPAIAEKHDLSYKQVWTAAHKLGLLPGRNGPKGREYTDDETEQIENQLRKRKLIP